MKSRSSPTFGASQDEAEALVVLLLQHHRLLVHHAVAVEEMASRAAVSAAHHPQHGHGRPARVEVHAAGGELVRPGQGRAGRPRPHPTSPSSSSKGYDSGPGSALTASPLTTRQKETTTKETRLPPLTAAAPVRRRAVCSAEGPAGAVGGLHRRGDATSGCWSSG